jgi:hypothetical protein
MAMTYITMPRRANRVARAGTGDRRRLRDWLYKPDYHRPVDRYIDFFGTGTVRLSAPASAPFVLRSLA